MIDGSGIFCKIALIWMSIVFIVEQSTLVQVMAWGRQATSHYLSQCWHRSMSPYGVTRPQRVKYMISYIVIYCLVFGWLHIHPFSSVYHPSYSIIGQGAIYYLSGEDLSQIQFCENLTLIPQTLFNWHSMRWLGMAIYRPDGVDACSKEASSTLAHWHWGNLMTV